MHMVWASVELLVVQAVGGLRSPMVLDAPTSVRLTKVASATLSANTEQQSRVLQAGTTPAVDSRPRVGFTLTRLFRPAGTRPDPAVSVPREKLQSPAATATADPELDPPEIWREEKKLRHAP